MPPQESEQSRWFSMEVQPNEPALRSYLRSRFPALPDLDDIIQETYRRLLRERAAGRLRHARAFMFTTARNAALDFFRHHRIADAKMIPQADAPDVLAEQADAAEVTARQQELEVLAEAVQALPERCRQAILLRYMKGYTYKEIAETLDVSVETVKTHLSKGLERCSAFFATRGMSSPFNDSRERLP